MRPWKGLPISSSNRFAKKRTHHQWTLGPAADDGLDEVVDAAALLALFDRRDKVVLAQDKVVVSLI